MRPPPGFFHAAVFLYCIGGLFLTAEVIEGDDAAANTKTVSLLLDLHIESGCNTVESQLPLEAYEVARQRSEAAQWTLQRMNNANIGSFGGYVYFSICFCLQNIFVNLSNMAKRGQALKVAIKQSVKF